MKIEVIEIGFRPLTGINFNFMSKVWLAVEKGFRPLTGINFNANIQNESLDTLVSVPLRG